MKIKLGVIVCATLLFSGCAMMEEMQKDWIIKNCNSTSAYNQGMRDGLTPHKMPAYDFASECPDNNEMINNAYSEGFSKGLRARPRDVNVHQEK